MLDREALQAYLEDVLAPQIGPDMIPEIDLYMDQVTSFLDSRLMKYKRHSKEKVFTKTMINNYTKAGILVPPTRKKYSKENLMLLILIYKLKHILSIQDIAHLFEPLLTGRERSEESIRSIYDTVLELELKRSQELLDFCELQLQRIQSSQVNIEQGSTEEVQATLLVLDLINRADIHKRLAERLIDHYFKS